MVFLGGGVKLIGQTMGYLPQLLESALAKKKINPYWTCPNLFIIND